MQQRAISRVVGATALVLSLAVAGCAGAGGSPSVAATAPPTAAPPMVIEDAGVEVQLPAGTYVSRLFKPALRLEVGQGWYRRDSNGERTLNLRRAGALDEDVTFISGPDFIECGSAGDPVAKPDAATIVAALVGSELLDTTEPVDVAVGDLTGTEIRLDGGGEPVPEAEFGNSLDFGCIASLGEAWPAESAWFLFMPDTVMQLILVEVDGTTVMIRSRPGSDPDGWFDFVVEAAKGFHLG